MSNCPKDKFLLLGDYNLSKGKWVFDNDKVIPDLLSIPNFESNILVNLSYNNLMQYNLQCNRSGSLLRDLNFQIYLM